MLEKIKNKKMTMRIVSVIISIFLWLMIISTVNPTITQTVRNIPVEFVGEKNLIDKNLIVIDEDITVDAKIRGPRSAVIDALSNITAGVDLSQVTTSGEKQLEVKIVTNTLGVTTGNDGVTVNVKVDDIIEKSVPVSVVNTNTEKSKDKIVICTPVEEKVVLQGSRIQLENIIKAEIVVDASTDDDKQKKSCEYVLKNSAGEKQEDLALVSHKNVIDVAVNVYEKRTMKIVPILDEKNAKLYSINSVSFPNETIDVGVDDKYIGPDELKAICNPDKASGNGEYEFRLAVPSSVHIADENKIFTAKIELKKKDETEEKE